MARQTITAFYDSRVFAENAALMLRRSGVPDADVQVSPPSSDAAPRAETTDPQGRGVRASFESMFSGADNEGAYVEGLRRGGAMVMAHVDEAKIDDAVGILEKHGSVDLDDREIAWRKEGWTGTATVKGGAFASANAGPSRSVTPPRQSLQTNAAPVQDLGADVLQVVEERLDVGKRAVNRGTVRIHSHVVETPVTETVSLRDETVTIDRRPVDRPVAVASLDGDAFAERMIEMEEIDEEAVVAKSARVVEEISIRKEVADHVQTINDTVRSTRVDIDDGRATKNFAPLALDRVVAELSQGMNVVGSDGEHVGVVDHVDGGSIKLKKMDPASGGQHHLIPVDWIRSVGGNIVLNTTAFDAMSRWTAA